MRGAWRRSLVAGLAGAAVVLAISGCGEAEEDAGAPAVGADGSETRTGAATPSATAAAGRSEAPAKLPRGEGRTPDGRKAPETVREGIPIPGKPGFIFNPWTNNPTDVRGIPAGTLVRDPQDPDKSHKFRVPKPAKPGTPEPKPPVPAPGAPAPAAPPVPGSVEDRE